MTNSTDTIVAVATGTSGAISVIRLSGDQAIEICDRVFRSASAKSLSSQKGYTLHYGTIIDQDRIIDDVIISLFRTPRSYTGENMIEISCHGSSYISREIVNLLIKNGARSAQAGEFTIRAFMAGKLDLAQAEAVADMIASTDRATHTLASNQMRGGYSAEFSSLRTKLIELVSLLELELDFSEEDVVFADRQVLMGTLNKIESKIDSLLQSFSLGNALKEGVAVAIVGSPNVGKSTLLNALLCDQRAMVSEIAGTTRDVIEESLNINGVRFRFLDTAGIRETQDRLEQMGIERTHSSIAKAQIVMLLIDASTENIQQLNNKIIREITQITINSEQHLYIVLNKIDKRTTPLPNNEIELIGSALVFKPDNQTHTQPSTTSQFNTNEPHTHIDDNESGITNTNIIVSNTNSMVNDCKPVTIQTLAISAKNGDHLNILKSLLSQSISTDSLYNGNTIISNSRHYEALHHSKEALIRASLGLKSGLAADLLSQDIRDILHNIGLITGEITTDEILGSIFSKFCIGK